MNINLIQPGNQHVLKYMSIDYFATKMYSSFKIMRCYTINMSFLSKAVDEYKQFQFFVSRFLLYNWLIQISQPTIFLYLLFSPFVLICSQYLTLNNNLKCKSFKYFTCISVLIIFLVLCCSIMCLYVLSSYCDIRYDFRIKTMFGSSLAPIVCRRDHVLLTLFVFSGVQYILCCVFVLFFTVLCTLCC